jgi:hypothetical protein
MPGKNNALFSMEIKSINEMRPADVPNFRSVVADQSGSAPAGYM